MSDEKELTPEQLYKKFGEEVTAVIGEVSEKLQYTLKPAEKITTPMLAKWERMYFHNGKAPVGKYSQWMGYINAAVGSKFFVKNYQPSAKTIDNLPPAHAALLFKAIDYIVIRCGQIDPNF